MTTRGITIGMLQKQVAYFADKYGESLFVTLETVLPGQELAVLCLPELTIEEIHYRDESRTVLNIRAVKE